MINELILPLKESCEELCLIKSSSATSNKGITKFSLNRSQIVLSVPCFFRPLRH